MSRALVLGGGGITGIAWELGVLAGLREAGLDLTGADLTVGTSAGSVVGAQITSGLDLEELYSRQLRPADGERPARLNPAALVRIAWAMLRARTPEAGRAHAGLIAVRTATGSETERRAVIASRLPVHRWPDQRLLVTAVDARSGALAVFSRDGDASLVDAVAASCAVPGVWAPVTIGGRLYIDGGVRSSANVDLADGHGRVVVLAPTTAGAGPFAGARAQAAGLSGNPRVTVVAPNAAAKAAIGRNVLDPERRAPAARAGRAQAAEVAEAVAGVWAE
ncbi:NTE family protein [Spinactinospora alkalitolerans]|uniref:NTE family protein n=1 Tax=Spinactinospora alkalitolerans TaxID=687207 RepID=A0A852TNU9_9ACTN|nr:patatin-like phospholipase family protein [Spinactinospora alkalitolerans]NYE45628.1 NTE family protein [Spinactinospora alkalitolerans]